MTYQYCGGAEEKSALTPPEKISFADFTEKYITLDRSVASEHGPKRLSRTPALRSIYEALGHPDVREVNCRKSAQLAVTSIAFDLIAFYIVQKPRPVAYFLPDEKTAEKIGERLRKTLELCKPVADLINRDRFNKSEMVFKNGASVTLSWGSSIAATGSSPYGLVIVDEADKPGYDNVGKEGSTLGRIRERGVTYDDFLLFLFSTPTTEAGNVSIELDKCSAIVKPFVPCPSCGHMQPLFWGRKKDEETTPYIGMDGLPHNPGKVFFDSSLLSKEAQAESARYVCGECGSMWTTAEKNSALSGCKPWPWEIKPRMGFDHLPRMYSTFNGGRLEVMAATWLDSQGDLSDLQAFINSCLGQVWKTYRLSSSAEELKKAKTGPTWLMVPDAADCIIVTVDMQQNGFWFVARAWSSKLKDSWLIECGQVPDWEDLDELFFDKIWKRADGSGLGCWRGSLDCGGTKEEGKDISRTEEAELWWIRNRRRCYRRIFLTKGSSRTLPTKLAIGKILETTPSGKKIAAGGLQIVELNTEKLKGLFLHALEQACKKASSAAFVSVDTPDQYFQHVTAEALENDGTYKKLRADNHWLDCEMQQQGLISGELFGGIDVIQRQSQVFIPKSEPKKDQENPFSRPESKQQSPFSRGNPFGRR